MFSQSLFATYFLSGQGPVFVVIFAQGLAVKDHQFHVPHDVRKPWGNAMVAEKGWSQCVCHAACIQLPGRSVPGST